MSGSLVLRANPQRQPRHEYIIKNTFVYVVETPAPVRIMRACSSPPVLLSTAPDPAPEASDPSGADVACAGPDGQSTTQEGKQVEKRTAVTLRNLPYWLTRKQLKTILDAKGLERHYDFLYMPIDFRTAQNKGFGFVNMVDPGSAARCLAVMNGFTRWPHKSSKVCEVLWCKNQGFDTNVERYRNSDVMQAGNPEAWKPAIFVDGEAAEFPRPTGVAAASPAAA